MVSVAGAHRASSLELLGSVLVPQQIEPDELNEVTALVDTASNRQSVLLSEEPYVSLPVGMPVIGVPSGARHRSGPAGWTLFPSSTTAHNPEGADGEVADRTLLVVDQGTDPGASGPSKARTPRSRNRGARPDRNRRSGTGISPAWSKELVVYLRHAPERGPRMKHGPPLLAGSAHGSVKPFIRRLPLRGGHLARHATATITCPARTDDWFWRTRSERIGTGLSCMPIPRTRQWRRRARTGAWPAVRRTSVIGLADSRRHRAGHRSRGCRSEWWSGRSLSGGGRCPGAE